MQRGVRKAHDYTHICLHVCDGYPGRERLVWTVKSAGCNSDDDTGANDATRRGPTTTATDTYTHSRCTTYIRGGTAVCRQRPAAGANAQRYARCVCKRDVIFLMTARSGAHAVKTTVGWPLFSFTCVACAQRDGRRSFASVLFSRFLEVDSRQQPPS